MTLIVYGTNLHSDLLVYTVNHEKEKNSRIIIGINKKRGMDEIKFKKYLLTWLPLSFPKQSAFMESGLSLK